MTSKKYEFLITTNHFLRFEWQVSFDSLPTFNELLDKLAEYIRKDIHEHYGRIGSSSMLWATDPDSLNICLAIDGEGLDLTDDELYDYLETQEVK